MWSLLLACPAPEPTPSDSSSTAAVECPGDDLGPTTMRVAPFVQSVGPTSAWIVWETEAGLGGAVDYGPSEDGLVNTTCARSVPLADGIASATSVFEAELTGLVPGATYTYRARTGATVSAEATFRAASDDPEAGVHLVAMGDSQLDPAHPDKFREVVQDGVLPWTSTTWGTETARAIDLVLLAGDLVDNGWVPSDWTDAFFAPAAPLLASVPLYPVLGNHEANTPLYFRYFHLPEEAGERWYTVDRSNLRVVSLDSNPPFDSDEQLLWLDQVLAETCADPVIDFVLAQLHHPYRSELWPAGESDWSGQVVARLEAFSSECGKPSIHFYGHTHAYSRGQSRDHQHLWVNVSSAGGALDRWGPGAVDQAEFVTSQDTWGFVALEVVAGDNPLLRLRRVDRGNDDAPADNAVTDDLVVLRYPGAPGRPTAAGVSSACDGPPTLEGSPFVDPDGDAQQGAQWQVAATCDGFAEPTVDHWRQEPDTFGPTPGPGDSLTEDLFPELGPGATVCWRVRYRDATLAWSEWSEPAPLSIPICGAATAP
ncbi:MAG: metallophosphoesterase [Myxococcota bacterium]